MCDIDLDGKIIVVWSFHVERPFNNLRCGKVISELLAEVFDKIQPSLSFHFLGSFHAKQLLVRVQKGRPIGLASEFK